MKTEDKEAGLIGKEVEASMDGQTWFPGRLDKIIDLMVPYLVYVHEFHEQRGFLHIRPCRVCGDCGGTDHRDYNGKTLDECVDCGQFIPKAIEEGENEQ